ncbi:hypothetical protein V3C99_017127, partial [Haemonchus contortus]
RCFTVLPLYLDCPAVVPRFPVITFVCRRSHIDVSPSTFSKRFIFLNFLRGFQLNIWVVGGVDFFQCFGCFNESLACYSSFFEMTYDMQRIIK